MMNKKINFFRQILDLSKISNEEKKISKISGNQDQLVSLVQREVFSNIIYALTPMNKVITLPYGSRVLDFAYAIHSDIGDHTTGAKINGVMMPLSTIIQSGDIVDVKTNPRQRPNMS